jgi:hypothetical protein
LVISERDIKKLWGKSAMRCSWPDCHDFLYKEKTEKDPDVILGEMAHIKGEKTIAARYDPTQTEGERDRYDNRILLCRKHHTIIDNQPNTYTVEKLHTMKNEHEKWVFETFEHEMEELTFKELEIVTQYLCTGRVKLETDFTLREITEKIQKNQLSEETERWIRTGLIQATLVGQFVERYPDEQFSERLKQGFVKEYERLKMEIFQVDDLFNALWGFASGNNKEFKIRAAGLAVLVYLFERCEVFEK